jgi:putative DNA primase/helicase
MSSQASYAKTYDGEKIQVYYYLRKNEETGEAEEGKIACGHNRTDDGNAQRFIMRYRDQVRYCADMQTWFVWDGCKWSPDTTGIIKEYAKIVVRNIHIEAGIIESDNESDTRKLRRELSKWAFQSESLTRIEALVRLASTDSKISINAADFDRNPWLINCPNGTLDLKARQLREHRPEDLITKISSVQYDPDVSSPEWYDALLDVLTLEQSTFLQRAVGSALTGINRDKALFVAHGRPNSRKSTVLDATFKTFGDYAKPIEVATFGKSMTRPGGTRADIVDLEGVRAAHCSEIPRGMVFNDAFVKSMTGANPRAARGLYEKHMRKIIPVCKFFIETNFLPNMSFDDDAAFNRFHIITFLNAIPLEECDPAVKEFLMENENAQKAIFAWAVQGCYDWQDFGLMPPDSVNAARKAYQDDMNPLAEFFKSDVIVEEGASVSTSDLYDRFKLNATPDAQREVKSKQSFGMYLSRLGYKSKRIGDYHVRVGIRLREGAEFDEDVDENPSKVRRPVDYAKDFVKSPCNITEYMGLYTKPLTWSAGRRTLERDLDEIIDDIERYNDPNYQPNW